MNFSSIQQTIQKPLTVSNRTYYYYDINQLEEQGMGRISTLPYSIKALLESAVRQFDEKHITNDHIKTLSSWHDYQYSDKEVPFKPARIIMQDFTGIPAIVDLAAMKSAVHDLGGDVGRINPQIPVDLVIDHSVTIDVTGNAQSFNQNLALEYERNEERYKFVRWAQQAFDDFRVVPPASGIVHQVNLEHLGTSVITSTKGKSEEVYLDTLVGTDSHTPMINGLGTIGWGVGGIEAEAAMLGQPLYFEVPEVLGVKFVGEMPEGSTSTDLALTITNLLREKGVVGKIVEFFGPSLKQILLADRATIANMAPEYGATMSFFPTDDVTMDYLTLTGREEHVELAKAYHQAQGMYRTEETIDPLFTEVVVLDLTEIVPTLAGPKRPQDKVPLSEMKKEFNSSVTKPIEERGYGLLAEELNKSVQLKQSKKQLSTGDIVLAAITSCTNTSNPSVMIAAGLVAKKAVEKGLAPPAHVKMTLTPGSTVVTKYLEQGGLLSYLERLGFYVDGYGCAACCGNTGPFAAEIEDAINENNLIVSSVLSGNRNFEGRVHPLVKANYLASPPLVVAYALAGTVQSDLPNEPLGLDTYGDPVYLKDLWPSSKEIEDVMSRAVQGPLFKEQYKNIFNNDEWDQIDAPVGETFNWDEDSTYIQEAPFLKNTTKQQAIPDDFKGLNVLLRLGDSITTDHISPVGHISPTSPAGKYLSERGVSPRQFNSYGSRRGNHHVMTRGTFSNVRLRNKLVDGVEGGYTKFLPTNETLPIYNAAMKYKEINKGLLIIAGKEYGTGSSRDWAAKGTALLGVKVVLAESYERIHRDNLVGMGVLPLQFLSNENADTFNLDGTEQYDLVGLDENTTPRQRIRIIVTASSGSITELHALVRLDSKIEVDYFLNGGILPSVMKQFI